MTQTTLFGDTIQPKENSVVPNKGEKIIERKDYTVKITKAKKKKTRKENKPGIQQITKPHHEITSVGELMPNNPFKELTLELKTEPSVKNTDYGQMETFLVSDDSGEVSLTLWKNQCGIYRRGQIININGGWCKEYAGQLQISTGRNGTIQILQEAPAEEEVEMVTVLEPRIPHRPTVCMIRGWMEERTYRREVVDLEYKKEKYPELF
ncbi:MAG: hypothetical protein GF334_02890 [Candidatus Altiarchaeales archaeon]|nr:hypothetical protein [Candidatus Altiarchaeales archaeon]